MSRKQKRTLVQILLAAAALIAGSLIPARGVWQAAVYAVPYLIVGGGVLLTAVKNIAHGQLFDEMFLMSVATLGAFALREYREAVAVMLFFRLGEWFQSIAVGKSRRSIAALMDIRPDSARVLREGGEQMVSPDEVAIGEHILLRPGERVPLDGTVVRGTAQIDTAALTGESLPAAVGEGGRVLSGSVCLDGVLELETTCDAQNSTVSQILELVENAAEKKAKTENFITRFAAVYTPCVVGAAVLLAVLPPLLFSLSWRVWLERALIFLVVSCPCALVISVPLSFFGGIGGASRQGILMKGATVLETLAKVRTVAFDKTGTLTSGRFTVTAVHPSGVSEEELLQLAAAAESGSNHPIAEALLAACGGRTAVRQPEQITEHAGRGVEAVVDGRHVFAGNARLMDEACADRHECHIAGTCVHVAAEGRYLGHIILSDTVKPGAGEALRRLTALGIEKTVMLTGDRRAIAGSVAGALGLTDFRAELLPADKVSAVETLLAENVPVAYVGDGINDAPVLARADVGVAMGALGSDAAIEAADVVLTDDNLQKLPDAIALARRTVRIVRQNIVFALGVKLLVLGLSAFGLAGMWMAVFADVGVTVLAIGNAMRTMRPHTAP